MARKSQHTFSKRQREQKKAEKAAQKRAKRAESKEAPPLLPDDENGVEHAPVAEDDVVASHSETDSETDSESGSKPESE